MKLFHGIFLIVLSAVIIVGSQSVFMIDEREQAIVLQLGQPIGEVNEPGLHFKIPLVQDVRRFDRRILSVDPVPKQMVISSSTGNILADVVGEKEEGAPPERERDAEIISGEPIIVDTFARYRITDPLKFMKTLRTIQAANQRIENIMNDATRTALGKSTLRELLSPERAVIMNDILSGVNKKIEDDDLGIGIIDIRIVRADLTPELSQSTVRRMISELKVRANETRAKGAEKALEIRSTAQKERVVILAEAQRDAQIIRGNGDKEAIRIYAEAFNKDKEFYGFIRSMEAYKKTMANSETRLILSPDSEFFRYFRGQN